MRGETFLIWIVIGLTAGWLASAVVGGGYGAHIASYNITYGALGSVIVLMAWFYLTGFIFLLGGEINVIFERWSGKSGQVSGPPDETESALAIPLCARPETHHPEGNVNHENRRPA